MAEQDTPIEDTAAMSGEPSAGVSQGGSPPDDDDGPDQAPYDATNTYQPRDGGGDSGASAPDGLPAKSASAGNQSLGVFSPETPLPPPVGAAADEPESPNPGTEAGTENTNANSGPAAASGPNRRSLNNAALVAGGAGAAWVGVLASHARQNTDGNPVDEHGKQIDLRNLNATFGSKLATMAGDLDAKYAGQYELISGVRTTQEQFNTYNDIKSSKSLHPVALPGHSDHEIGLAVDFEYTGPAEGKQAFYRDLHKMAEKNGLNWLANDPNHIYLADANIHTAMQNQKAQVQMASINLRQGQGRSLAPAESYGM